MLVLENKKATEQGEPDSVALLYVVSCLLADGDGCEPVEDAAAYSKENNAYSADGKCQLGVEIALEGGQRLVGGNDVHCLDDKQIVVETHNGVDQRYEHY